MVAGLPRSRVQTFVPLVALLPLRAGCGRNSRRSAALKKGLRQEVGLNRECRMAATKKEGGALRWVPEKGCRELCLRDPRM